MTTTNRTLGIREAVTLSTIIGWAQRTQRVEWLNDRNDVESGLVRSIGDDRGNFLGENEDVRDGYVRITTSMGFEWFVPISEIVVRINAGTLVQAI